MKAKVTAVKERVKPYVLLYEQHSFIQNNDS